MSDHGLSTRRSTRALKDITSFSSLNLQDVVDHTVCGAPVCSKSATLSITHSAMRDWSNNPKTAAGLAKMAVHRGRSTLQCQDHNNRRSNRPINALGDSRLGVDVKGRLW